MYTIKKENGMILEMQVQSYQRCVKIPRILLGFSCYRNSV